MNNRRKLIVALAASAFVSPLSSLAQPATKVWRVGFLTGRRIAILESDYYYGPFRGGMRELGYVEGKNLLIEWRSADGETGRLPTLAAELADLKVDVIVAAGTPATAAAQKATTTIPIVMGGVTDPVGSGFVKSLAHPGGNITGLSNVAADVTNKHLEMLLSMVPKLSLVGVLVNPANASHPAILKRVEIAAQSARVKVLPLEARNESEIENAFSVMARQKAGAVIVAQDGFYVQHGRQIAELAIKHLLPSISGNREFAESRGLLSYGTNLGDQFRRTTIYVDKIFKGAKPGDLPVEQPTRFELFINGKTAKALGLKIPQSLMITAEKVLE